MKKTYKLVIFDFDGTLVDSAAGIWHAANAMAKRHKLRPFKKEFITKQLGSGFDNFLTAVFPEQVRQLGLRETARENLAIYDEKYKVGLKIYPKVKQTLKYLRARGIILAIASNKPKKYVDLINSELGLARYFDTTLGGEEVKRRKPDPFVVHYLMKKYGLKKKEVLFVGDSRYDVETAKNAGVDCVYLEYGYAEDEAVIKRLKPEFWMDDFGDIRGIAGVCSAPVLR